MAEYAGKQRDSHRRVGPVLRCIARCDDLCAFLTHLHLSTVHLNTAARHLDGYAELAALTELTLEGSWSQRFPLFPRASVVVSFFFSCAVEVLFTHLYVHQGQIIPCKLLITDEW